MRIKLDLIVNQLSELRDHLMEGHNHTDGVVLDMLIEDLKAAIVPDWRPASEPLLDEREVIVLCRDGSTVIDYKINGLRWSWVSDSDAVAWHEIEVPEPPEVQ